MRRTSLAAVIRRGAPLCALLAGIAATAAGAWGSGGSAAAHKTAGSNGPAAAIRPLSSKASRSRRLAVSVETPLRANAEVARAPARKRSSLVPAAGELRMEVATGRGRGGRLPGRTIGRPLVLTRHWQVGTARSAINHLPATTGPPGECPVTTAPARYLWITFRAHRAARPLARAQVDLADCGEGPDVALTVRGRRAPALSGSGKLISEIECGLQVHIGRDGVSVETRTPTARAAAEGLFCRLKLPAGAKRVQGDPSLSGRLGHALATPSYSKLVDVHRFWRVPGSPCKVMGWIERHPAAGAGVSFTAGGNHPHEPCRPSSMAEREAQVPPSSNVPLPPALPSIWGVGFSFPEPQRFLSYSLEVELAAAQGGGTAMRADALVEKRGGTGVSGAKSRHHRPLLQVAKVPLRLPARGVYVDHQFILHPAVPGPHALSRRAAITLAHQYVNQSYPPGRALFATLTIPGTIPPPHSKVAYDEVAGKHVWIVVVTAPHPFNASEGGPAGSHTYVEARHLVVALDARTGAFLRGFDTK